MNKLPFEIPEEYFVELRSFTEKIPKYPGWRTSKRFKPFISPTAIETRKYPNGKYLFVLDFDYEDKWANPLYKQFKYSNTYTRESNHGLHLYYWSTKTREIVQRKTINGTTVCNVDFKGMTRNAEITGSRGGYVVYYDKSSNNLPMMTVDCNILIEELYKLKEVPIIKYTEKYRKNSNGQYLIKNSEIQPYHIAIAKYLERLNRDWNHGYNYSWNWGRQLGGVLNDELEAESIATALMNCCDYPMEKKKPWVINFVNGYNASNNLPYCNIGGNRLLKRGQLYNLSEKIGGLDSVDMEEFVEAFKDLKLHQYIRLVRSVKTWI